MAFVPGDKKGAAGREFRRVRSEQDDAHYSPLGKLGGIGLAPVSLE